MILPDEPGTLHEEVDGHTYKDLYGDTFRMTILRAGIFPFIDPIAHYQIEFRPENPSLKTRRVNLFVHLTDLDDTRHRRELIGLIFFCATNCPRHLPAYEEFNCIYDRKTMNLEDLP